MVAKKKLLGLAVVLGAVAGGVIALVRTPSRTVAVRPESVASTNAVVQVVQTNAITNVAAKAVKVKGKGEQSINRLIEYSNNRMNTSNLPPVKVRKPITNDPKIPKARQVLLANRRIAVEKGRSFPKKFCATQTPTSRGTAPYVVISELPVSRDVRIQAVADGAKVIGFLPNNALLVEADQAALKNLEEDVLFLAAVEYEPTDKIQRALLDETGATVEATVVLLNEKDYGTVRDFVAGKQGRMLRGAPEGGKALCAEIPKALITELAGKAEVKWIERYARMKLHNDVAVKPGLMNVTPVREAPLGLTGAGQTITTTDSGIDTGDTDTMHQDLTNAVVGMELAWSDCYDADYSGHGTHTAGSIVGDGTMSGGRFKGAAPGAKLWAWFCEGYDETSQEEFFLPPMVWSKKYRDWCLAVEWMFRPYDVDACVHSASWGGGYFGEYSAQYCAVVDAYVWEHPDFLPVFAAGNEGDYYGGSLAEDTVGQPGTAKNILTVGASENLRPAKGGLADSPAQVVYFSSCGPCADGRIKPDLVAPGTYVMSCLSSYAERCNWDDGSQEHYQYMGGTSMATPLVAGTAALVREWLARFRKNANPSAALVKAILTGGATDLKYESGNNVLTSVPDTRQGWGRVNLADSIASEGMGVFMADKLPFGARSNFVFRVTTTNAAPLNVQLVWVDYPGQPSAAKVLVNDLDLSVTAAGQTWLGNGGTEPDDLNNVESVRIREAAVAMYVVSVTCPTIPNDYREGGAAAIYIRGAFDPRRVKCGTPVGTMWTIL